MGGVAGAGAATAPDPVADAAMATAVDLTGDLAVGVAHLWPLAALPVAVGLLGVLVLRGGTDRRSASPRSRRLLFASRVLVATLLVAGAMGPYTVQTRETPGEPRVTLLTDESASTAVYPNATDDVVAGVEAAGVPVTTATIAGGTDSRVGDGIVANLRENGTVVVLTDARVTGGRSLAAAAETARQLNATVSSVALAPERNEAAVSVAAPETTTVGLETTATVSLSGVGDDPRPVNVTVDGEVVASDALAPGDSLSVSHTFETVGAHRVTARVGGDDVYARNDAFYRTVRVVERPNVLYVARGDYPLRGYLDSLYNVTSAPAVPADLADYAAVVVQDAPASRLGNVSALQDHVVDGGGLVVVGGDDAYEAGGYATSPLAPVLPVRVGNATGGTANLVLLVDISGSAAEGLATQKAVALDVLSQLADRNRVGVVAFNNRAYRVADLRRLADGRGTVADRIRRLEVGRGGTNIDVGLQGARDLLDGREGTVILLSDGNDDVAPAAAVASQLGRAGRRVVAVGAGRQVNEAVLREIAAESGGTFFPADETDRLRLLFGGGAREFAGENLTVVTRGTFVTSGVELTASADEANRVAVKSGADYHVATGDGTPAVASWRFGLGRVVSVTAYGEDGTLDGLLREPDSLLVTRSVNYAVGDPLADRTGVAEIGDARVGRATPVVYRGETRPTAPNLTFRRVGDGRFRAEITPRAAGYREVLDAAYAANYAPEYGRFGADPGLSALVAATGGRTFAPDEGAAVARLAREQATRVRTVRERWGWLALLAALVVFAVEVLARRLQVYRGRTSLESGLP